jgi:fructose-1,6-bisphosphatase I
MLTRCCPAAQAPSEECSIEDMDNPESMMQNCIINVCQPGNALLAAGCRLPSCCSS